MHEVAAQATARLLTRKVVIPAGAVALNLVADQMQVSARLEASLTRHSGWAGPKGMVVRSMKRAITHKALTKLGCAVGPVVYMHLAEVFAEAVQVEEQLK